MSDDEFTQHELHPSSPAASWDGVVWDNGSQPLWDDASQTLWAPSPPHMLAQLPSAASTRLSPPSIGSLTSLTRAPFGRPPSGPSNDAPTCGDVLSPSPPLTSSPARPGVSSSASRPCQPSSPPHAESPSSESSIDGQVQVVSGARPTRRAALDSGRRTSDLYVAGGILDSQTSDSQYVGWKEGEIEIETSDDSPEAAAAAAAADVELRIVDTSTQELARLRVELDNTRRQLYEYVGRWILARAHGSRLEQQLSDLRISYLAQERRGRLPTQRVSSDRDALEVMSDDAGPARAKRARID